ncbi:MFS transporter [Nocardiopsis rhodophaea]|uniref:MFS transporter n=1 Tax=Nocardiopsis rhodophaea TaxID=280238 RepID=UPI0031DDF1AA
MTPSDPYEALTPAQRTLVTLALLGCAFLAMLDSTVVGTALPRIVEQIGGSGAWYIWLVTAYLLTSSVSVPVYGRFSDLYGRRRLILGGLCLFLIGSVACAISGSMGVLIVSRAAQGLGAGALLTLGMALIRDLYPPSRTDGLIRMQTAMALMMVIGLVGGPLLGGLLADHAGCAGHSGSASPSG